MEYLRCFRGHRREGGVTLAPLNLQEISDQIIAVGALGMAAYGLVDASKAFRGGVSNAGFRFIRNALAPFGPALQQALGPATECDWRAVMRSHWISGRSKDEQKAIAVSLIQLGLTRDNAQELASAGQVDGAALRQVVISLENGEELTPQQLNLVGRFKATIEVRVDAAYDRADQTYRNWARLAAGLLAILLAVTAGALLYGLRSPAHLGAALLVGLVAVPLAPVAKDIASALGTAAQALGQRVSR
jgi:hypothetical protein